LRRRAFIQHGTIITAGLYFKKFLSSPGNDSLSAGSLYSYFKDPGDIYYPFVRWWWSGDKIEKDEITRELRLLKDAGISGVEITPIKFPAKTEDLGKGSVPWLSDEWINLLHFALKEAKSLGITCDLLVGSGWPFGGEWLKEEERSQIVVIGTKTLEGPMEYEASLSELFKEADPAIYSPFQEKKMEMLAVKLLPSVVNRVEDAEDISDRIIDGSIKCKIPDGKYVLYALVKVKGFMQVIQGAPGATGPVLNHYNKEAVKKYLSRMSLALVEKLGPLSSQIRSFFCDSLELEGANWSEDMQVEFQKRRGYDLLPWLPFLLYKIRAMGNTFVFDYGVEYGEEFEEMTQRVRYDFELVRTELLRERFFDPFISWCKENNVQSRAQAYGRGYFPLEGSFGVDIPECETWIRPGLGTEMDESEYWMGRAYTVVNKFVSSAAHLKGKQHVSCEELTNIHVVFNESLELMKIASDQSLISGVTHSILHGFNYSPPAAKFPGWVIYGSFINEKSPWWKYFHYFTEYKARLSALLQHAIMFADIAVLPATADLWSIYGAQNDPFPAAMQPSWQTLIWEAIHKNGNGCDYISEQIIQDAKIQNGFLHYGPRKYHTIILTAVERMDPVTAKKLFEFVASGGRVFCIGSYPERSCGLRDHLQKDKDLQDWINKLKTYADRFTLLKKPERNFIAWFRAVQDKYKITPYVHIDSPNPFLSQVRYQAGETEILFFINSSLNDSYDISITPSAGISSMKQAWLWNPETGNRSRLTTNLDSIKLQMSPADLKVLVFDMEKNGASYNPVKLNGANSIELENSWSLTGNHIDGRTIRGELKSLKDLREIPKWVNFCGNLIYRANFELSDKTKIEWVNLGKVFGVSELLINGQNAGTQWYGRRIFHVGKFLKTGNNNIEVHVTTTMGNYMKSLTDNPIAQVWTNEGRANQPTQSMGMVGPVTIY